MWDVSPEICSFGMCLILGNLSMCLMHFRNYIYFFSLLYIIVENKNSHIILLVFEAIYGIL